MADIHVFFAKSEERSKVYELLQLAVEKIYNISGPKVTKDENGKPYFPGREDIHFSLSHSGQYVMCALSSEPVGADIQKDQSISDKTVKRVFTEAELESADTLSLWCLKESFIKLHGKLDRPYREIEFIKSADEFAGPDNTWGKTLNSIPGHSAAVCACSKSNVMISEECFLL